MTTLPIYQVDAFADQIFAGNPAAICPLDEWLSDDVMQNIAAATGGIYMPVSYDPPPAPLTATAVFALLRRIVGLRNDKSAGLTICTTEGRLTEVQHRDVLHEKVRKNGPLRCFCKTTGP